jgi:AraC-like DNA-binding protein
MSISSVQSFRYQPALSETSPVFFELHRIQLENSCVASHSHRSDHYKIYFLEEGKGRYQIDFQEFEIDGTGIFCLSPGQVLTVESEAMKSGYQIAFNREFYCVETHGKEIACNGVLFNNVHRATVLQLSETATDAYRLIVQNMIRELENPGKAHREMLETYLRMFLIEVLRMYDEQAGWESGDNDTESRLAESFIALVEKHFRTIHAVSDYAEKLFVSPKSLAKRLNAHGYKTPTEIIRDRVILEAKRDLRYTSKTVKEIAFDLGFEDPAYFTRYFKKAARESPLAYRESYQS